MRVVLLLFFTNVLLFAHGMSQEDKLAILNAGYIEYIWLGAVHMLTGYDHLLFLVGVLFFLNTIKDIIKFITVFTLGHSITLIVATFLEININYYLIDSIIALSIIYKAFENMAGFEKYLKVKSPNLVFMVFSFGLIHGLGLSSRLQELPLGDDNTTVLFRIISFNIGVELGQVLALIPILILLNILRKVSFFELFSKLTNFTLIFIGFLLFQMQLHSYVHIINEEELGFNHDEHYHVHEKMNFEEVKIEIDQTKALIRARKILNSLILENKIDKSWKNLYPLKIEKKEDIWIVKFDRLEIYMDRYGKLKKYKLIEN